VGISTPESDVLFLLCPHPSKIGGLAHMAAVSISRDFSSWMPFLPRCAGPKPESIGWWLEATFCIQEGMHSIAQGKDVARLVSKVVAGESM
jgi:hypothetical protein